MKVRTVVLLVLSVLVFARGPAAAQVSVAGAINGTVADSTDAVLPGVIVILKDEGTGITKEAITNDAGAFAFRDLSFGSYQITVNLQGFRGAVYNKVVVESGRTTDLRIKLSPGGLEEAITVEGTAPVLEMTSNVISTTLNRKAISELPLAGRNVFTFARLVPGAVARKAPAARISTACPALPSTRRSTASTTPRTDSRAAAPASSRRPGRESARSKK